MYYKYGGLNFIVGIQALLNSLVLTPPGSVQDAIRAPLSSGSLIGRKSKFVPVLRKSYSLKLENRGCEFLLALEYRPPSGLIAYQRLEACHNPLPCEIVHWS